jgi:hypothetical protein
MTNDVWKTNLFLFIWKNLTFEKNLNYYFGHFFQEIVSNCEIVQYFYQKVESSQQERFNHNWGRRTHDLERNVAVEKNRHSLPPKP